MTLSNRLPASIALQTDRRTHGEIEADLEHGTIQQDLGPPPADPDALAAWKHAAGTLTQARTITFFINEGHFNPDSPTIGKVQAKLATDTEQAVTELANHYGGLEHIPALQQPQQQTPTPTQTRTRAPRRGPTLGL